ncbi:ABC transporter permease [Neolewinella antarctica]|uniref:Peptide/nickel transport system permease protein n=1 Tax=Neolewinella antarctica TaxID=442734 RepID=A0ABX0XAU0_9BACT|nr:ABC transporter permease [Neolewinella antarctica]NJC26337.1 peptide/nickel transport system permease protein [Neolewinella antarctica]
MENNKRKVGWAHCWIILLVVLAVFADLIANDRPLIACVNGELHFPVLSTYSDGFTDQPTHQKQIYNWYEQTTDWAVWPPVPYDGSSPDLRNANYRSPSEVQQTGTFARHLLGTDRLGRDVLASLIHGTRVALLVGFGSVLLSLLIGVPLGGAAGFFGNTGLRFSRASCWATAAGISLGLPYAIVCLLPYFDITNLSAQGFACVVAISVIGGGIYLLLNQFRKFRVDVSFPLDGIVLQILELFVNVPGAVFLIAVVAFIEDASLTTVIVVVGILGWTAVARFLRAEMLRVRSLPYIEAAYGGNISSWRILFVHALPNAIGPLLVIAGFMMGSAILLEAFLSFLGIGIPNDLPTWGSLLRRAREQPSAWWLAVFPGVMLTATILAILRIGERKG